MLKKVEVKTYKISKVCPQCKEGQMIYDTKFDILHTFPFGTTIFSSGKAVYPHDCDKCGFHDYYDKKYPFCEYVECAEAEVIEEEQ